GQVCEAKPFELRADRDAALRLIQEFAELLHREPVLHDFAERLKVDDSWRSTLANRAGNNLWILTEVLDAVRQGLFPGPQGAGRHFRPARGKGLHLAVP